ncbi:MAG: class I SAM-dependent methyltransferase [Promethearchaeota archaeon]
MTNLTYISSDLSSLLADVQMDITDVPFEQTSFDVVLCTHVFEHVVDDYQAMRECFRVLKPGGWAILQSPVEMNRERTFEKPALATPEDRARTFGHPDHVRVYGRDYVDRLESVGFAVQVDDYASEFAADSLRRFGLDKHQVIYVCTRPSS